MGSDRDFLDAMRGLEVRPLDGPPLEPAPDTKRLKRPRRRPPLAETDVADPVAPEEAALFLEAMGTLGLTDAPRTKPAKHAAAETLAAETLAAETLAAETLAAETLPAQPSADNGQPAAPQPRRPGRGDPVSQEDRAIFLAGVEKVGPGADKDTARGGGARGGVARDWTARRGRSPAAEGSQHPHPERSKPRRATAPRSAPTEVDDRLDLHRERQEPALERLHAFLVQAAIVGHTRVLVITGKGHHSEDRRGVLRQAVETWLIQHGGPWVARYAVAPRALGGRGAWILDLHP